jgi:hypothetical protein
MKNLQLEEMGTGNNQKLAHLADTGTHGGIPDQVWIATPHQQNFMTSQIATIMVNFCVSTVFTNFFRFVIRSLHNITKPRRWIPPGIPEQDILSNPLINSKHMFKNHQ